MTELYELLPRVLQRRDVDAGLPLKGLLTVIEEQRRILGDGIDQLYDDWFIETCADWVVPYLGELLGYRVLSGYDEALTSAGGEAGGLLRAIASRVDVADTIAARRRKGTLPLLEDLAADVTAWPARAVEFRRLLAHTAPIRLYPDGSACARSEVGRVADVRRGDLLDRVGGPFEELAHSVDVRRIDSPLGAGRFGIDEVGVFVWRLGSYPVTHTPAYCRDRDRTHYTFSVLGNDTPLGVRPTAEPAPSHLADETNVPGFIRRLAFERNPGQYYGPDKSLCVWISGGEDAEPAPLSTIAPADLSDWAYTPPTGRIALDPVLGRIAFPNRSAPELGVWVSYHHLFSADLGGGEYPRAADPSGVEVYRAGPGELHGSITAALAQWRTDTTADIAAGSPAREGIVELVGSAAYQEQLDITVNLGDRLTIRAAPGSRPVIRLLDWYANRPDALRFTGSGQGTGHAPRITLDGLLVCGRSVQVRGDVGALRIVDCTLVPGWSLTDDCRCEHPDEPSLELIDTDACVQIDRCILGRISVVGDEIRTVPNPIYLSDSILDSCTRDDFALSGPDDRYAHVTLSLRRTTVFGGLRVHGVGTAENSIVTGLFEVACRQQGCVRFCWVAPGSRVPPHFHCVPDRAEDKVWALPVFTSERYGTPGYAQLHRRCAGEITCGAEDGSELGAFHDLFQPQRMDNLTRRLAEYSPVGTDTAVITVT